MLRGETEHVTRNTQHAALLRRNRTQRPHEHLQPPGKVQRGWRPVQRHPRRRAHGIGFNQRLGGLERPGDVMDIADLRAPSPVDRVEA